MLRKWRALALLLSLLIAVVSSKIEASHASQPQPSDLWLSNAPRCLAEQAGTTPKIVFSCPDQGMPSSNAAVCFPTKVSTDSNNPCDDGDMTLFNGLICAGGNKEGCRAVMDSQDPTSGRWYRSPRRRLLGGQNTVNSFSPDMAIGVSLWLATHPTDANKQRFARWIDWLAANQRCVDAECTRKWPRFCPDDDVNDPDAEYGCTFRLGDLATIATVANALRIRVSDVHLAELFERYRALALTLAWISAQSASTGYSLHVTAATLHLFRELGLEDVALSDATMIIFKRQPKNPYFAGLAGETATKAQLIGKECPSNVADIPNIEARNQWSWERDDNAAAWRNTMLWDCAFAAAIFNKEKR